MAINYWFNTPLAQWTKDRQQYKDTKKKEAAQKAEIQRQAQGDVLFDCAINSTDPHTIQQYTSASNLNDLAVSIGKWINETTWKTLKPWLEDNDIVCSYLNKYPEKERDVNNYLSNKITLEEAQNKLGLYRTVPNENQYIESDTWWDKTKRFAIWTLWWIGTIAATDATLYWVGKLWQRWGKQIYNLPIDKTMKESSNLISAWASIKDAEVGVKDAKQALKDAKASWVWVEEAEKALATAQDTLKNAKAKWSNIRTIWDTAMEYDIWGWLTEWWTAQSRWIQAKHEANQIFKKTIAPALENSKATINVQELIDWLADDIKEIAKNDPDKLNAYNEALESLKDSYKWKEFAKYSLKDSQTLKSWLQWRTPQKFWKWQEITNEIQELKWLLSSKLKNAVHSELTKEIWEDSAKLYLDRANLDAYSKSMAKQATNAWLKQGFWWFWSTAFHNLTDGSFAKWWLLLDKVGKWLQTITNPKKMAQWVWDVWNYVVKNGKNFFKATKWWMARVEDPVGLVQLLRLVPWSIWEAADAAAESPAVAMDDLLFEIQDFKDTWNNMSDEERIQNIKDQFEQTYGSELNDESAIETYKKWKEKHPSGKYWFRDTVNDVELIMKA